MYSTGNDGIVKSSNQAYTFRIDVKKHIFWAKETSTMKFFDKYIIPLAQKLKDCKALGVSGEEYMMYALQNREEWATKGKQIVGEYLERAHQEKI
jgi:hypothetical protein